MKVNRLNLILFLIPLIMYGGCIDERECVADSSDLVKITFYRYPGDRLDSLLIKNVTLNGSDSLFYKNKKKFSMNLPLNSGVESLPVIISRRNEGDSLFFTLNYQSIPGVISEECGIQSEFTLSSLSNTLNIDSVAITNSRISEDVEKNIEIYRKDCSTDKTRGVFISFHDLSTEELTPIMINNVVIANDDNLYYVNSEKSKINLPLNPDFTSLPIIVNRGSTDNSLLFTINYTTDSYLISDWCGEGLSYALTDITETTNIDSVAIVHTNLSSKFGKNIEIYLAN